MSTAQEFDVVVSGINYHVYVSTRNNNDHFTVTADFGPGNYLTVTDSFGECNPLRTLWKGWQYQSVHGAARASMEIKCIKDAVVREIEAHIEFCLQLIEDDIEAEEREAHDLAVKAREAEALRIEADAWNRTVQSAAARRDAQAAHDVQHRLGVVGNKVIFDGKAFGWERTAHGNIKIDRALNDAARASGLRGQAVGELYSIAQHLVSAS